MKNLLKLEELAQFLLCLGLLIAGGSPWWIYVLLALGPDVGMLGYLVSPRAGAITYNLFHHKAVALVVIVIGLGVLFGQNLWSDTATENVNILAVGIILYGHASMDRIFGYGLKFGDSFQHTHLGWIGKRKEQEQGQ